MIFRTRELLIAGLILITLLSGCTNKAASPNIDAQKKVISTYLEGLRDRDESKVLNSINNSLAQYYVGYPKQLQQVMDSQKAIGSINKWTFKDDTIHVDEINNQTIVNVIITSPMVETEAKFDLRKEGGKWLIYGSDTVKQKNINSYHGKGKSSDKK